MSRASTKHDLMVAANEQFDKMWKLIDSMSEEEQNAAFDFGDDYLKKEAHWARDRNLRDVLVHLYEWHQLLLIWVKSNQNGEAENFLPEPYNWRTYAQMNVGFWEKHQSTPYLKSKGILRESHADVMKLIDAFTNDEMFTKNHFTWTGTSPLGSYCVSVTASHYDWAMKKIKQDIKTKRNHALIDSSNRSILN